MKKVFLIHGLNGNPNGGWRPWLMSELQKLDIYALALSMPNSDNPILSEWLEEMDRYIERCNKDDEVFLVGHSLGGLAILRYMEKCFCKNIKGVILVSTPCNFYEKDETKNIFTFFKDTINWNLLKNKNLEIAVIQGDDDSVVPMVDGEEIARELNGKFIVIPNGKHLNGSAGFLKLPQCLEVLINFLNINKNI